MWQGSLQSKRGREENHSCVCVCVCVCGGGGGGAGWQLRVHAWSACTTMCAGESLFIQNHDDSGTENAGEAGKTTVRLTDLN